MSLNKIWCCSIALEDVPMGEIHPDTEMAVNAAEVEQGFYGQIADLLALNLSCYHYGPPCCYDRAALGRLWGGSLDRTAL